MGGNMVSTVQSHSRKRPLPDEFRIDPRPMKKRRLYYIKDNREMRTALKEAESGVDDSNSTKSEIQGAVELLSKLLIKEETEDESDGDSGFEGDDELPGDKNESENKSESKDENESKDDTEEDKSQDKRVFFLETIIETHTHTHSTVYNFENPVQGVDPILQQLFDEKLFEMSPSDKMVDCAWQKAFKKALDEEREDALCRHFERAIIMPSSAAMDLDEQDEEQLRHK